MTTSVARGNAVPVSAARRAALYLEGPVGKHWRHGRSPECDPAQHNPVVLEVDRIRQVLPGFVRGYLKEQVVIAGHDDLVRMWLLPKPVVEVGNLLERRPRSHKVACVDQKVAPRARRPCGAARDAHDALDCRLERRPTLRRKVLFIIPFHAVFTASSQRLFEPIRTSAEETNDLA
jgi:hypothetical protein